jgi:hypothetical protein
MADTLKIIRQALEGYDSMDTAQRLNFIKSLSKVATVDRVSTGDIDFMCPVTKEGVRSSCNLTQCRYWVDHDWTKNCALSFLTGQEEKKAGTRQAKTSDRLSVEQISMLYRKSAQRIDSIFKRSFKVVQRHYLRDVLREKGVPRFTFVEGFCVTCQSQLLEEELADPVLSLGDGKGYCSLDCKKQHPPAYYEIERFFEAEFLRVVEVGSELFTHFYLEEILGFQPNVLRNRLEKLREESTKKEKVEKT